MLSFPSCSAFSSPLAQFHPSLVANYQRKKKDKYSTAGISAQRSTQLALFLFQGAAGCSLCTNKSAIRPPDPFRLTNSDQLASSEGDVRSNLRWLSFYRAHANTSTFIKYHGHDPVNAPPHRRICAAGRTSALSERTLQNFLCLQPYRFL